MRAATFQFCVIWLSFVVVIADNACSQVSNCNNCYNDSGTHRCTQCDDGYYGDKCSSCQSNCVTCVSQNNCSGCWTGYFGLWCSLQCDPKCVQTECYQYNGTCVHGCPGGYYQAGSNCYKCSIHNCEECSDLYHCTRCASGYNLWSSDSYTYCNVGCPPGTWGVQCQYNCSSNCTNLGCHETNGFCDNCTRYTYGDTCQYRCSDGCNDGTTSSSNMCDKQTGQCIYGCKPGYSGTVCDGVDGQWGQWTNYTSCSVTCDWGSMSRSRSCDQPEPQNGGLTCNGSDVETAGCNLISCPDIRYVAAETDSIVGVTVGGVFGGAVVGFVGGLLVGFCIFKKKCWRRGQKSGNQDNTCSPPSVAYVNITDTADGVIVSGNESGIPAYESLDRRAGPNTIYTELETRTS